MADADARDSSMKALTSLVMTVAAVGGLVAMFTVGRRQPSILLIAMFVAWVLAPYVALALLNARAKAWPTSPRTTMQYATIIISLAALARYIWVVVWPLTRQPASTFILVPVVQWVTVVVVGALAMRAARRARSRTGPDT